MHASETGATRQSPQSPHMASPRACASLPPARSARTSLPVLAAPPSAGRSTSISTTSPSMTSVSSLMRTPMALRNACVSASVLLISMLKISEAAMVANGVSSPSAFAMPCGWVGRASAHAQKRGVSRRAGLRACAAGVREGGVRRRRAQACGAHARAGPRAIAIAVLPVPGWPARSTARPAMWPSLIMARIWRARGAGARSERRRGAQRR
jgi:hypothetical protein